MSEIPRDRWISVGAVARMAGVTVDTVRTWDREGVLPARRTPGRQRRYLESEVLQFLRSRSESNEGAPTTRPRSVARRVSTSPDDPLDQPTVQQRPRFEASPSDLAVLEARAGLEVLRVQREREAVARAMRTEAEEASRREEKELLQRADEARLKELKAYGRSLVSNLPVEWQARVTSDLESYVTPQQFPPTLLDGDARAYVAARVQKHRGQYSIVVSQELEALGRERSIERLVQLGKRHAFSETLWWGSEDTKEAAEEVERVLRQEVAWNWKEDQVRELVDDILDEYCEEEDDDD